MWPLSLIGLSFLMSAIERLKRATLLQVARISWVFGFVTALGGYFWLYGTLVRFSELSVLRSGLLVTLYLAYVAFEFVLFGCLWFLLKKGSLRPSVAAVLAFAAVELVFPNPLPFYYGASLHELLWLTQVVDVGGPILLGSLCALSSGVVFEIWTSLSQGRRPSYQPVLALAFVFFCALGYGALRVQQVDAEMRAARSLSVGVVHSNFGIDEQRDPAAEIARLFSLSRQLEQGAPVDLIIWPESAYKRVIPAEAKNLRRSLRSPLFTPLLFGASTRSVNETREEKREFHHNTAVLLDGEGQVMGKYQKTRLLPFGEYMPGGQLLSPLRHSFSRASEFTPGQSVAPLILGDVRISVMICYEDIFPQLVRFMTNKGAPHLLVNITNDAWFGGGHEPRIHLALSRLRAIEQRRPLVRANNGGQSAVIDAAGRLLSQGQTGTAGVLKASIPLMSGRTLYARWGDWWGVLSLCVCVWNIARHSDLARLVKTAVLSKAAGRPLFVSSRRRARDRTEQEGGESRA